MKMPERRPEAPVTDSEIDVLRRRIDELESKQKLIDTRISKIEKTDVIPLETS